MNNLRWRTVLVAVVALVATTAWTTSLTAQATGTVSGTVTDRATGRPLSGVRLVIVGGIAQGVSNDRGRYAITNAPVGSRTIRAASIGYTRVDVSVTVTAGQTVNVDFEMRAAAISLDEIIVTGTAGRTERRAIGNSVNTVRAAEVVEAAGTMNDFQELLTARTPGLTLIANTGQAGASSNIRIRGAGSIEGGYEPVYYIDGVRFESETQDGYSTGNGVVQGSSPLDFINPDDVQSIEVIKGPAAATLYGSDAAGGIIQIITKKGERGALGVQWNANVEAGESEWTEQVGTPVNYWLCTPSNIADPAIWPGCAGMDPNAPGEQRLLMDDPVRRHPAALRKGQSYAVNLSARGGGQNFNYYLSFNRDSEEGVFFNNFANRTGGRANFGFAPSENLDIAVNFGYARTHNRQPLNNNSSNGILRNGFRGRAGASNDPWERGFRGFGPTLSNEYNNQTRAERTTIGVTANYQPFGWLENRLTVGLDKQDRKNTLAYAIDTTGQEPWGSTNATGTINHFLPVTHTWTVDYTGTASTNLSDNLRSSTSAGMQLNARQRRSTSAWGQGLVANNLNLVSSAASTFGAETFSEQTSLGFYVQEQLAWNEKLYGTAAVRIDDNSAFGSDFSLVVYPKASLSYVISDENFFNIGFIDQLKLRGAWGRAGNAPDPFTADRTFTSGVTTVDDQSVNLLRPSSFGNTQLKAETGQELELGFDASIFGGGAGVEFTYYNQSTKDALIAVPDAPSSGFFGEHLENIGEITNVGVELLLTASPIVNSNFQWDAALALSGVRNRLKSFNGARDEISFGAFATVQKHIEGFPLGGYWSKDVERDASGSPILNASGGVTVSDDFVYEGPSLPTREASLSNTFTLLGNLRIYTNFDYKGGGYQWCAICSIRNRIDRNTFEVNDPNADPTDVLVWRSLQTKTHIFKSDFIKFRELSFTYTLPSSWSNKFGSSRTSMTLSGRNLAIWTKYKGTGDPEVSFYSRRDFNRLDYASLPQTRRIAASLRVSF